MAKPKRQRAGPWARALLGGGDYSKITIRELEHKNIIRIVQGPLCKLSTGHHHKLRHLPSAIDFDFELDLDLDLDSSSCRLCRRKLLNLEMREDALIICLN
uniref:HDC16553 n=1 Tax=Drosophila melanogaster TaxID=7227 RepID=Q6IIY8_DROME|nr:TPA_inf: HDC16553 [Drosophila melanogaster]